jgi:ubiquinone/menaquinone biosynthesis C-methylase UbiE
MVQRHIAPLLPAVSATVLDVGTGAADTPLALLEWANRSHRHLDVTGLDVSPQILEVAREVVGRHPVTLVPGDARALPFPDTSFDVVISLGVLHHFDGADACRVLREMWRVARIGIVVADLERSYPAYLLAQVVLRTIVRNPLTRHDGLISVKRSYTAAELRALAGSAGLTGAIVHRHFPLLQVLVARRG